MNRRSVVAGLIVSLSAPIVAPAQRLWRIGTLDAGDSQGWSGFRDGLRDLNWEDGQNVAIEVRWTGDQRQRYDELAVELVRLNVDLLVTGNWQSAVAAKRATSKIPIVMLAVPDPPAAGLVGSFDRPDGNVTGVSFQAAALRMKSLEMLRELRPGIGRLALLYDPTAPASSVKRQLLGTFAARESLHLLPLAASSRSELETALAGLMFERPDVLVVDAAGLIFEELSTISDFAIKQKFPTMSYSLGPAPAGVLMCIQPALYAMGRAAASYANRILNGAHPADLPVARHTKFELIINTRIAKALGLIIPSSVLLRADQILD